MTTLPLLNFAAYFALAVTLWGISIAVYVQLTPYREFALVRQGNLSAALTLAGALLGFALPLASLAVHAASLMDMLIWAGVALVAQIALWLMLRGFLFKDLAMDIPADKRSVATVVAVLSAVLGLLNAACLSY